MEDQQKGSKIPFPSLHFFPDHLNFSLDQLIVSKQPKLLYDQNIELTEIKLRPTSEKSSEISEKSPFLKSEDYVNVLIFNNNKIPSEKYQKKNCKGFFSCCRSTTTETERIIYFNGTTYPVNKCKNIIVNTKYNFFTLIPIVIYNQFKFFFNLFYLFISLSQFIYVLKVGYLFTYIAPLAFVLLLTILKEAYDDMKRYQKDREVNLHQYEYIF